MIDNDFIYEAIKLSLESIHDDCGGPFGAVVVKDGKIIGKGKNRVTPNNDPTAHAEIVAIRAACAALGDFSLEGCELYTSCYPCPMCMGAIYWSRIDRVYYANSMSDAAKAGFDDEFFYNEIRKEPEEQKLEIIRIETSDALEAFKQWRLLDEKKAY